MNTEGIHSERKQEMRGRRMTRGGMKKNQRELRKAVFKEREREA